MATVGPVTTATEDLWLVGVDDVAQLCKAASRRTVEDWLNKGWLIPEATVATRHLWQHSTILQWDADGRPRLGGDDPQRDLADVVKGAGLEPMPELVGTDYIADRTGRKPRTVFAWRAQGKLPEPDCSVSFSALIWRRTTIDAWVEAESLAVPA